MILFTSFCPQYTWTCAAKAGLKTVFSIQNNAKCYFHRKEWLFQNRFSFFPVSPTASGHSPQPSPTPAIPSLLQTHSNPSPNWDPSRSPPPHIQPSLVNSLLVISHICLRPVTPSYFVLNMFLVIAVYRNEQNHVLVWGKLKTDPCCQIVSFTAFFGSVGVYQKKSRVIQRKN